MDQRADHPLHKKTKFQIEQEELRKTEELRHKHEMQKSFLRIGIYAALFIAAFFMIGTIITLVTN